MSPLNDGTDVPGSLKGSQAFMVDPRNADALTYVNGQLIPRSKASVSVLDSGFVLGDGIWESFRLQDGCLIFLEEHLDRLLGGAKAVDIDIGLSKCELIDALVRTMRANQMHTDVHVRLMVSRGLKLTPYQDPRYIVGAATVVIVAEHKNVPKGHFERGISLVTSSLRCTPPEMFDMRLNSHSRLSLVLSLIQAIKAGADEALLLDPNDFVSTCNGTNFFIVRGDELWTSVGTYCFNGITRARVIELEREHGVRVLRRDFTLQDVHSADEAFVTATYAGVTPVSTIDGHRIGSLFPGTITRRVSTCYQDFVARHVAENPPSNLLETPPT